MTEDMKPGRKVSKPPDALETEVRTAGRGADQQTQEADPQGRVLGLRLAPMSAQSHKNIPVKWLVIGAAILMVGAAIWFWTHTSPAAEYLSVPGNGHIHTSAILSAPGSQQSSLWLGTHEGLFVKALSGEDTARGWRKMAGVLRSTDVMALGAARAEGSPIYAAGHNIGVQRSDDGGATWRQLMPGAPTRDVHALAVDPENSGHVYLWAEVIGLLITSNGGATWEAAEGANSLKNTVQVTGLMVSHPSGVRGPVLYAGSNLGLFISHDNGISWTSPAGLAAEQPIYSLLAIDKPDQQNLYAGTAPSILHSADGGQRWEELKGAAQLGGVPGLAYDASIGQPERLLAVNAGSELYQSSNSGITWSPVP